MNLLPGGRIGEALIVYVNGTEAMVLTPEPFTLRLRNVDEVSESDYRAPTPEDLKTLATARAAIKPLALNQ